jgi:hypothetical protein
MRSTDVFDSSFCLSERSLKIRRVKPSVQDVFKTEIQTGHPNPTPIERRTCKKSKTGEHLVGIQLFEFEHTNWLPES